MYMCIYICVYIYIYIEREMCLRSVESCTVKTDAETNKNYGFVKFSTQAACIHICIYIYGNYVNVYVYIYIHTHVLIIIVVVIITNI